MTRALILAAPLALALAGCVQTHVDCTDLAKGACVVDSTRFGADTSLALTGPRGLSMDYSSNPNAQTTAEAFKAANAALGIAGALVGGRLPVPIVPGQPQADAAPDPEGTASPAPRPPYRPRNVSLDRPAVAPGAVATTRFDPWAVFPGFDARSCPGGTPQPQQTLYSKCYLPGFVRGATGTCRLPLGDGGSAIGLVRYLTPGGHAYAVSRAAWLRWAGEKT